MTLEKFDLTGKTALITGSVGLLGMEHAAALLESGATVVLTDLCPVEQLYAAADRLGEQYDRSRIVTAVMDVTNPAVIGSVAENLHNQDLRVDILVNNAAIDPKVEGDRGILETSRLEYFPVEQWNLQLAVGITGAFLCSKIFGGAMALDGKGGVILNIASDLSVIAPDHRLYRKDGLPDHLQPVKPVTYSVIKAGIIGLTRYLATYWADKGVRCNALSPGGVYNGHGSDFVERLTSLIPLGRMADRGDYRSTVQFLCSDASAYMTGQNIVIDGGRSVL
ncbi:SDR family oxidoreductase [Rhodobacterales bacterium LSUCC0387]|nr:SDR family oxidoreductase [Rhodobacterales bacterium LSUCC0387]